MFLDFSQISDKARMSWALLTLSWQFRNRHVCFTIKNIVINIGMAQRVDYISELVQKDRGCSVKRIVAVPVPINI